MEAATLVYVSDNPAIPAAIAHLDAFDVVAASSPAGYMNTLIDRRCAMIVIDARHPDWRQFTTAPKSSSATRRIPILVVSDKTSIRAQSALAGADLSLSQAELEKDGARLIAEMARVLDDTTIHQLACECAKTLPDLGVQGVQEFNRGNFYEQHDLFEALWVQTPGPVRDLYRAILQVGVAYYHIERGNPRGALKMLQRSVQWLHVLPDLCQGIDVEQLRRDSYQVRAELERLGPQRMDGFDRSALKPLRWCDAAAADASR